LPSPAGVGVIARDQDELAVGPALERLDVIHRDLGLVVAIGLEMLRGDAELLARDVEDRPLHGRLRYFDVGLGRLVLRGGHVTIHQVNEKWEGVSLELYPAIHVLSAKKDVDARHEAGHGRR